MYVRGSIDIVVVHVLPMFPNWTHMLLRQSFHKTIIIKYMTKKEIPYLLMKNNSIHILYK